MKIAVLDWGVGGLGFYKYFKSVYSESPVVYWSDAGWTPYGFVAKPALQRRIRRIAANLAERDVSFLVIACNAASSVFKQDEDGPFLLSAHGTSLHATGVVAPTIRQCLQLKSGKIGVIGGRRTVQSGVYRRRLISAGYQVSQRVAQPLSARIERGDLDSPGMHRDLKRILTPLRCVNALVLGCTHYPAVAGAIRQHLPDIPLIDPARETMKVFTNWWRPGCGSGEDEFVTTGDPGQMIRAAALAFRLNLPRVGKESLG